MMLCGSSARLIARIAGIALPSSAFEEIDLAEADAVLAGARAVHGDRAHDDALVERLRFLDLARVVGIDQDDEVEVAVADVTEERRRASKRARCPR